MYVKVRKSEVDQLEKYIDEALAVLKDIQAKNEMLAKERDMLVAENKFLKGLVDKMAAPTRTYPETFKTTNPWEQPYGPVTSPYTMAKSCAVCGLEGTTGYVCTRNDCPTKSSCST